MHQSAKVSSDAVRWGIHAGKTGDAFSLFTEGGLIALGWERVPDLSQLPNDAESFREAVTSVYPEMKAGAVPVAAGQLRRFIFEMAIDDIAVFPAKEDWTFRLGRVTGPYQYIPDAPAYPHHRSVEWLKTISRDVSLGSAAPFMPSSLLPATRGSSTPRDQPSEAALELHSRRPWEVGSQAEEQQLLLARDDRPSRLPIARI